MRKLGGSSRNSSDCQSPLFFIPIPPSDLCRLPEVSPADFYRWTAEAPPSDVDIELRDEIQRIAPEFSYYGSRRVAPEPDEPGL